MKVSVIVAMRGGWNLTRELLYSLYGGNEGSEVETIVLHDGLVVEEDGGDIGGIASIFFEVRGGYADGGSLYRIWNEGLRVASGEYIGIVNNDVLFMRGWDRVVCEELRRGKRVVCPLWSYPPGRERPVSEGWAEKVGEVRVSNVMQVMKSFAYSGLLHGRRFSEQGFVDEVVDVYRRRGLAGFCFFTQRAVYDLVGKFDEGYGLWFGDNDFEERLGYYGVPVVVPEGFYVWHIQEATVSAMGREAYLEQVRKDEELWREKHSMKKVEDGLEVVGGGG